jgi:neutral ceramidase
VETVSRRVREKYGVPRERLLFNYSHNHSCPVTGDVLHLYYPLMNAEQRAAVARYTERLYGQYVDVIGKAIEALAPATLEFEQGLAGFAVNRRRARPGGRSLPGPVDHDVPVMVARDQRRSPRAILFGYSCHTTALSGSKVNGDYAGYAQEELEKAYPGATALFVMGCGGDANPLPRIMGVNTPEAVELATMYGRILAAAVKLVVNGSMKPVEGPLKVAYGIAAVPFQKPPTREELLEKRKTLTGNLKRYNEYLLSVLEKEGKLMDRYAYPVQAWMFGKDLTFIGLTGENVVDYCLRFKKEYGWDNTWVAGYNNELLSYIPSLRVLKEGGYEGTEGVYEYGLPGPYGYAIEEVIAEKVKELVNEARRQ